MIRILVVVPYGELDGLVQAHLAAIDIRDLEIEVVHFIGTGQEVAGRGDADIVVARGMTMKALARANPGVHPVEIPITAGDLIAALWRHRDTHGARPVGIVLTDTGICDPDQLRDLTGIPIHFRKSENETELVDSVSELSRLGIGHFIGGSTLCRLCADLGLAHVHIKSGEEAITQALGQAVAAARALNRERTRAKLVATVLDSAEDVMFAVSRDGAVIAANSQASALLLHDRSRNLEGALLAELSPELAREAALPAQGGAERLMTVGDQVTLVKTAPIAVDGERLGVLVTCRNADALREAERKIRKELGKKGLVARYDFGDLITANAAMKALEADAYKYSQVDSSVFIIGETGTGKELFAQSIHNASTRRTQPFVAVNCAALPEPLLESELFGYSEGAFSGAAKGGRVGLFELAHRGTIFLDEIGEMPLSLQAKILRVLQEREIRKVGGDAVVPVDVRIVSATNIDILERVRRGAFREDLYYRINLLNLAIPPLRRRPEDIELLFRHFVRKRALDGGRPLPSIGEGVGEALRAYSWPGNIRELRNFAERLVILNEAALIDCPTVEAALELCGLGGSCEGVSTSAGATVPPPRPPRRVPRREEGRGGLAAALAGSGLDMAAYAASLGISRTTLWRRLKREEEEG